MGLLAVSIVFVFYFILTAVRYVYRFGEIDLKFLVDMLVFFVLFNFSEYQI